eukprot:scaffold47219_cov63-Phaeocystis_antarctica.AAC.1
MHEPSSRVARGSKLPSEASVQPGTSHEPSSTCASSSKLVAEVGDVRVASGGGAHERLPVRLREGPGGGLREPPRRVSVGVVRVHDRGEALDHVGVGAEEAERRADRRRPRLRVVERRVEQGRAAPRQVDQRRALVVGVERHRALARHGGERADHGQVHLLLGVGADALRAVGARPRAGHLRGGALEGVVHAVEGVGDAVLAVHPREPRQVGPWLGAVGVERVEGPEVDAHQAAPAVEVAHVGAAEAAEAPRECDGGLRLGARLLRVGLTARHARHEGLAHGRGGLRRGGAARHERHAHRGEGRGERRPHLCGEGHHQATPGEGVAALAAALAAARAAERVGRRQAQVALTHGAPVVHRVGAGAVREATQLRRRIERRVGVGVHISHAALERAQGEGLAHVALVQAAAVADGRGRGVVCGERVGAAEVGALAAVHLGGGHVVGRRRLRAAPRPALAAAVVVRGSLVEVVRGRVRAAAVPAAPVVEGGGHGVVVGRGRVTTARAVGGASAVVARGGRGEAGRVGVGAAGHDARAVVHLRRRKVVGRRRVGAASGHVGAAGIDARAARVVSGGRVGAPGQLAAAVVLRGNGAVVACRRVGAAEHNVVAAAVLDGRKQHARTVLDDGLRIVVERRGVGAAAPLERARAVVHVGVGLIVGGGSRGAARYRHGAGAVVGGGERLVVESGLVGAATHNVGASLDEVGERRIVGRGRVSAARHARHARAVVVRRQRVVVDGGDVGGAAGTSVAAELRDVESSCRVVVERRGRSAAGDRREKGAAVVVDCRDLQEVECRRVHAAANGKRAAAGSVHCRKGVEVGGAREVASADACHAIDVHHGEGVVVERRDVGAALPLESARVVVHVGVGLIVGGGGRGAARHRHDAGAVVVGGERLVVDSGLVGARPDDILARAVVEGRRGVVVGCHRGDATEHDSDARAVLDGRRGEVVELRGVRAAAHPVTAAPVVNGRPAVEVDSDGVAATEARCHARAWARVPDSQRVVEQLR